MVLYLFVNLRDILKYDEEKLNPLFFNNFISGQCM